MRYARMVFAPVLGLLSLAPAFPAVADRIVVACPGYESIDFCAELTGDCDVTSSDALVALRISVGQLAQRPEADVDNSGLVTSSDSLRVLRMAVGALPLGASCGKQYGLNATATGFYQDTGSHTAGNYAAGWYSGGPNELRDYFVFDISSVPGTVDSALLHLSSTVTGNSSFSSPDASETFSLFAVSTAANTVSGGSGGIPVFTDLGNGTLYGSRVVNSQIPKLVDISLNASGLAYLNGATSQVVFGGAITTLTKGASSERVFNSTNATLTRQLIVTVE